MSAGAPTLGEPFGFAPDPEAPGWFVGDGRGSGMFVELFGAMRMRAEAPGVARIRLLPERRHRNVIGTAHGGYVLAVIDQALFLGAAALGVARIRGGVTLDVSAQFFAPLAVEAPIDVLVELLRETGNLVFTRGTIEQAGTRAVAFSGTIRKARAA